MYNYCKSLPRFGVIMKFPLRGKSPDTILADLHAFKGNNVPWQASYACVHYAGAESRQLRQDAFNMYMTENGMDPCRSRAARCLR